MLDIATSIASSGIRMAIPFLLTALGETITERSGVRNLGLEGIILVSAFGSFFVAARTGSAWLGLLAGVLAGGFIGLVLALAVVKVGANQLIVGVMVTTFGWGLSSFLYQVLFGSAIISPLKGFSALPIPLLSGLPFLGSVLFNQNVLVYGGLVAAPLVATFLFKTNLGLRIRACGENPRAAESVGMDVYRMRYVALVLGTMLAGVAGSYLVLADLKWFSHGMSAGRGWIALAIVIFGRWTPYRVLASSLLFGGFYALQFWLQGLSSGVVPYQLLLMLPYLMILVSLMASRQELGKPVALGAPFRRSA